MSINPLRSICDIFIESNNILSTIHQQLQEQNHTRLCAISGMVGVGKTELALQYAQKYRKFYSDHICYLSAKESLTAQTIKFARSNLGISIPLDLNSKKAKLSYCWANWEQQTSLIVLDDVPNYREFYRQEISPWLPPITNNIKILITSRENPGHNIPKVKLNTLTRDRALTLLTSYIGKPRIQAETEKAEQLCQWLGNLPLGIKLVGKYAAKNKHTTIADILKQLQFHKLEAKALTDPKRENFPTQSEIVKRLKPQWDTLDTETQQLAIYLSSYGSKPFDWSWVENALIQSLDEDEKDEQIEYLS